MGAVLVVVALVGGGVISRSFGISLMGDRAISSAAQMWAKCPSVQRKDAAYFQRVMSRMPSKQRSELGWNLLYSMIFVQNVGQNRSMSETLENQTSTSMQTNLLIKFLKTAVEKKLKMSSTPVDVIKQTSPKEIVNFSADMAQVALTSPVTAWSKQINNLKTYYPSAAYFSNSELFSLMSIMRARYNYAVAHLLVISITDESEIDDVLPNVPEYLISNQLPNNISSTAFLGMLKEFFDAISTSDVVKPSTYLYIDQAAFDSVISQVVKLF